MSLKDNSSLYTHIHRDEAFAERRQKLLQLRDQDKNLVGKGRSVKNPLKIVFSKPVEYEEKKYYVMKFSDFDRDSDNENDAKVLVWGEHIDPEVIIDQEDKDYLRRFEWKISNIKTGKNFVYTKLVKDGELRTYKISEVICGGRLTSDSKVILIYLNGNQLDNRLQNLVLLNKKYTHHPVFLVRPRARFEVLYEAVLQEARIRAEEVPLAHNDKRRILADRTSLFPSSSASSESSESSISLSSSSLASPTAKASKKYTTRVSSFRNAEERKTQKRERSLQVLRELSEKRERREQEKSKQKSQKNQSEYENIFSPELVLRNQKYRVCIIRNRIDDSERKFLIDAWAFRLVKGRLWKFDKQVYTDDADGVDGRLYLREFIFSSDEVGKELSYVSKNVLDNRKENIKVVDSEIESEVKAAEETDDSKHRRLAKSLNKSFQSLVDMFHPQEERDIFDMINE